MASSAGTGSIANNWRDLQGEHWCLVEQPPRPARPRPRPPRVRHLLRRAGAGHRRRVPGRGWPPATTRSPSSCTPQRHRLYRTTCLQNPPGSGTWRWPRTRAWRRDIVVAWRGTLTDTEVDNDKSILLVPATPVLGGAAELFPDAKVHRGFLNLYTSSGNADSKLNKLSARDQVLMEVGRLVEMYKDEPACGITVTGHSLGGSLAMLNAVDIVANGWNTPAVNSSQPPRPVTAIVFACPRIGNDSFKSAFDSFGDLRALQVKNDIDIVPKLPLDILGLKYVDMGVPLPINTAMSPYLKDPMNTAHNLECYLHGVAGEQGGAGGSFKLVVNRNVALVNKDADALKDGSPVPAQWWALLTSFMLMNAPGKWELKDFNQILPVE